MSEVFEIIEAGELDAVVANSDEVVIRFTAPWCTPCRQLAPHMAEAAKRRPETKFVYVDVDKCPWAVVEYGIQSIPQVLLYRDGSYVKHLTGRTVVQILSDLS